MSARRLAPGSTGLVLLLGGLTAAGPMSTDLYLSALPNLAQSLSADTATTQLSLSAFTMFFGLSGLALGPLSDRYGRRVVVLCGLSFYFVASLACALAPTIEALIGLRAIQAVGAATGPIVARAIARDLHDPTEAARLIALMAAIMGLVPALAPSLGALALDFGGWRGQFVLMASLAFIALIAVFRLLDESLAPGYRQDFSFWRLIENYRYLLGTSKFLLPVALGAASFAGFFAFIAGSSFVLQGVYGASPALFAACFGLVSLGYIAGTFLAGQLVRRWGGGRLIRTGAWIVAGAGLGMNAVPAYFQAGQGGEVGMVAIVGGMVVYAFGMGWVLPQSSALSITPFPQMAGTASAMQGALNLGIAALTGALVGHLLMPGAGAWPMIATTLVTGLAALTLSLSFKSRLATP